MTTWLFIFLFHCVVFLPHCSSLCVVRYLNHLLNNLWMRIAAIFGTSYRFFWMRQATPQFKNGLLNSCYLWSLYSFWLCHLFASFQFIWWLCDFSQESFAKFNRKFFTWFTKKIFLEAWIISHGFSREVSIA